ncbi:MAG TPA: hypothetical protein VM241_04785 [Candidatus Thermoplasmatota archaeon]|nr:hypothetical protein [Candidatus Thermoplasmatota archaeon]
MGLEFPGAPRLLKGALAVFESDQPGPPPRIVAFQYNPESLKRTLASRTPPARDSANVGAAREDTLRVLGPPTETITLTVALSAADPLAEGDPIAVAAGIHPALATLELLLYPRASQAKQQQVQAELGQVQLAPATVPLTLLVWGPGRVVPVLLTGYTITEEQFDPLLNPVQAKVDLSLRVLTTVDLRPGGIGHSAYTVYHMQKEAVAGLDLPALGALRGLLPKL